MRLRAGPAEGTTIYEHDGDGFDAAAARDVCGLRPVEEEWDISPNDVGAIPFAVTTGRCNDDGDPLWDNTPPSKPRYIQP